MTDESFLGTSCFKTEDFAKVIECVNTFLTKSNIRVDSFDVQELSWIGLYKSTYAETDTKNKIYKKNKEEGHVLEIKLFGGDAAGYIDVIRLSKLKKFKLM